jgi:hypothetical protein
MKSAAHRGKYWFDYRALYQAIDAKRAETRLSWNALATQLGVAAGTLRHTEAGGPMEADGIRAMVAWLGLAPEFFVRSRGGAIVPQSMVRRPVIAPARRRFDKKALYAGIEGKRAALGMTWNEVAREIGGVSVQMLKNLNRSGRTSMDLAVAGAGWLGRSLESFTYESLC